MGEEIKEEREDRRGERRRGKIGKGEERGGKGWYLHFTNANYDHDINPNIYFYPTLNLIQYNPNRF